jgi:two-component system, OmpR family, response regulator
MDSQILLLQGLQILIIDSNFDSRELLTILFERYNIEVVTTASVSEAIAALSEFHPDLIVSEIFLPGEDGYMLMQKLKALNCSQIPVIALTTLCSASDRANAKAAGFYQHLPKPLDIDRLINTIVYLAYQLKCISIP